MTSCDVALIDADFMAYSIGFTTEDDPVEVAQSRLQEWLNNIVYIELNCSDYKAYITGPKNFRYEVAKTVPYKANRKDVAKPKHLDALKDYLRRLGAVEIEGIEADDAVAIDNASEPGKYIIVAVDKDLDQLPGEHYNPVKQKRYTVTEFEAAYNFWKQMLTGDRVDNIPGLAGIGPKKAEKILKDCKDAEEMQTAVWKAYKDKGHDYDYFVEQGRLLWLLRTPDEIWQPRDVNILRSKPD